jgi:DNA repair exonuclease SbcCD ATPase subunit
VCNIISFKSIKWKNFLSTGNTWTEIDLVGNKTTLIVGENGSGKSTLLDALSFALYSKPFRRINKPQLINSTNQKNTTVELEFEVSGINYKIIRGLKPNIFEIWKNGELLNQDAASADYQEFLEQNILKMNFKSFGQIVVLGSSTFIPFMQLSAASRREVIEDLLDIQVFSIMSAIVKEKISENKASLTEIKHGLDLTERLLKQTKEHNLELQRLKQLEVDKIKNTVKVFIDNIERCNNEIGVLEKETETLADSINDKVSVEKKKNELNTLETKMKSKLFSTQKEMEFYKDTDNCPTCKQIIDSTFKCDTLDTHTSTVKELTEGLDKLKLKQEKIKVRLDAIAEVESAIYNINMKTSALRTEIKIAKNQLGQIKEDLKNAEDSAQQFDGDKVTQLNETLKKQRLEVETLTNQKELLTVANFILKDGGIKTRIIRQYIPIINKLINKYLSTMEFVVHFELNEQFEETIKSRFRDQFSYFSFSEGEKKKLDIAILLTWRAIARLRNSVSTNLLLMDEVLDGALDAQGVDYLTDIISTLNDNSNVFVISHNTDAMRDKFAKTIHFVKNKGFSTIQY